MASLGAKVLHVRSVELAMAHKVRRSSGHAFDDPDQSKQGTLICSEEDIVESQVVTGIASRGTRRRLRCAVSRTAPASPPPFLCRLPKPISMWI